MPSKYQRLHDDSQNIYDTNILVISCNKHVTIIEI